MSQEKTVEKVEEVEIKVKGKGKSKGAELKTMEDAVKRYSEKWNVSEQEAAQKLLNYIERQPNDQAGNIPQRGNIFPEPLTEFSKKVQGLNQAILSTEWTKHNISELRQPPRALQEIAEIRGKVTSLENTIQTQLKSLQETIEAKNQQEAQREVLEKFGEMMKPLSEKIEALELVVKDKPGTEGKVIKDNAELSEAYGEATDAAQVFLKQQGFIFGKPGKSGGMSGPDQLEIYKTILAHQDKKDDRLWDREKARTEQEIQRLAITEREKTIRGIAKDGFKRAQPLFDAFSQEGEKRLRSVIKGQDQTQNNIVICSCGTEIPITGTTITCPNPECGKEFKAETR